MEPSTRPSESQAAGPSSPSRPARTSIRFWAVVAGIELAVAAVAVIADVFLPTLVILVLAAVSLLYRRQGPTSLGFLPSEPPLRMATRVLGLVVAWTIIQLGLFIPVLEHLTGERQDPSTFEDIKGSLGTLLVFLILSWSLAAIGEETAYRGFTQTRAIEVFGDRRLGLVAAVGVSAVLFGLAHTEQGVIGGGYHLPRCHLLQCPSPSLWDALGADPCPRLQ